MRRLHLGVLASVVPALLVSLALVGCGGKEEKTETSNPKTGDNKAKTAKGEMKAIEPGKGTLSGKVTLDGAKPDLKMLTEELQKAINGKADDKNYCLSSPDDQKTEQEWRIGDNNGVGNVFVWIEPASRDEYFKVGDAQAKAAKDVVMDQPFCAFVPHCVVLFPKYRDPKNPKKMLETGQKLVVKNDAKISHNTKVEGGNVQENKTLPPGAQPMQVTFDPSKDPITIRCNIHPWMSAYARAFSHPYATLTLVPGDPKAGKSDPKDPKYGTYEIKNVPAGKVKVYAWHEKAGYLGKGAGGEEIELKDGANTKDFTAKANK